MSMNIFEIEKPLVAPKSERTYNFPFILTRDKGHLIPYLSLHNAHADFITSVTHHYWLACDLGPPSNNHVALASSPGRGKSQLNLN